MKGLLKREDDFLTRRAHLAELSDDQLKEKFWSLVEQIVDPLLETATSHTSPSIERSVLLRMGFSSIEAQPLVDQAIDHGLISKGVGHVIYKVAKEKNLDIRQAGLALMDGQYWEDAIALFKGGKK